MAKTSRLGITLPEDSTTVTKQFFIDRFNEIDKAETQTGAQTKVNALKAITQNHKLTGDDGTAQAYSGNVNNLHQTGRFYLGAAATNRPFNLQGLLIVDRLVNNSVTVQIFISSTIMATRYFQNAAWGSWIQSETPTGSQRKVDDMKTEILGTVQNKKITNDSGNALISLTSGSILQAILDNSSTVLTFSAGTACTDLPSGITFRGIKVFVNPTYGYVIGSDYNGKFFTNYYDGGNKTWGGWKRLDNGEVTYLRAGHGYTLQNIPAGKYFFSSSDFPAAVPPIETSDHFGYLEVTHHNHEYRLFKYVASYNTREYINAWHAGVLRGWKEVTSRADLLWSGDSSGNFTSNFTLRQPLTMYDYVYIEVDSPQGYGETKFMEVAGLRSNAIQRDVVFNTSNITDTENSLTWSATELAIQFNAAYTSFKQLRCNHITMTTETGRTTRADNVAHMGVRKVIGIIL